MTRTTTRVERGTVARLRGRDMFEAAAPLIFMIVPTDGSFEKTMIEKDFTRSRPRRTSTTTRVYDNLMHDVRVVSGEHAAMRSLTGISQQRGVRYSC